MDTLQILRDALQTCIKACPHPPPKDVYAVQQWAMAGAHAFILNGLISVYEQAATIPPNKSVDFVGYALQWTGAIHDHHHTEERSYFPMFKPMFDTSFVEAEHGMFTPGLAELEAYLVSCLPSGAKYGLGFGSIAKPHKQQIYNGIHVCAVIDGFVDDLCKHLTQELVYMEPAKLRASGLTEDEMRAISAESRRRGQGIPLTTSLVYVILHSPKEIDFPPIPSFLRNYLVPYVFAFPNRHLWQFAPKHD